MKKMNSILMLCLVMVVTSCAKPTNETKTSETTINTTENNMESIIFDAAKKTDQNAAEIFDLGSVSATGSVTKTFSISNTTGSNLTLNFTDLQAKVAATTRFSLNLATATPCSTTMKTNKTCSFDLTLKGVSNESYDAISTNIIDSSSRGSNAEFGSMVFSGVKSNDVSSSVPLSSVLRIDRLADSFIVPSGSSVTKRFYIGNIGTAALQPISIIAPDGGTISLNSCTALTALKPNGTCFFEIKYTSDSAPEKASYNSAITFGSPDPLIITTGLKIDLAITNQQAVTPVVSANFNQVGTISDLTSSTAKTRLYINNTGSTEIAASSITIPSPFLSSATSCSTLKVGKSCFYDLTLDTTKTVNSTTIYSTITIGSSSFSIKAGDLTKSATTCKSGFSVINNSCSASTVTQACSANGGTGTQTSSDGGVTFGSCQLASCSDSKYAVSTDKLSCQAISCTTSNANIANASSVSGTLVSGCVATSCTSGYVVTNGICAVIDFESINSVSSNGAFCAKSTNGSYYCWGNDDFLGVGYDYPKKQAKLDGAKFFSENGAAFSSSDAVCIIDSNDNGKCIGHQQYGSLGDGVNTTSFLDRVFSFSNILNLGPLLDLTHAQDYHAKCAIDSSNDMYCWGLQNQLNMRYTAHSNLVAINASQGYSSVPIHSFVGYKAKKITYIGSGSTLCFINMSDEIYCVGQQTGTNTASIDIPVKIDSTDKFKDIYGLSSGFCGLNMSGALICWGSYTLTGTAVDHRLPINESTTLGSEFINIKKLASSGSIICIISNLDKLYCVGTNYKVNDGVLTTSTVLNINSVDAFVGTAYKDIALSSYLRCGIKTDGKSYCWGLATNYANGFGLGSLAKNYGIVTIVNEPTQSLSPQN